LTMLQQAFDDGAATQFKAWEKEVKS